MSNTKNKIILFVILLVATFLRLYSLGSYPALNADEASIGYDAYSLIETGKDQHGNPWPVSFQSFNDYKPGLTVYLVLPFIKIFGLSVFWLRFLPAMFGVGTVYFVYLLVKELKSGKTLEIGNWKTSATSSLKIEEIASLLLAISPWHIHFSRGAWEVNISTFFITLGTYLFIKSLQDNKKFVYSALAFTLSIYAYHSAMIITPLMVCGLFAIYRKDLYQRNISALVKSTVFAMILLLPFVYGFLSGSALERASGVGLTADPGIAERSKEQQLEHFLDGGISKYWARLLHNKYTNTVLVFGKNWTEHFDGNFLFISGDGIQRNKVPDMGQLYLWEILTLVLGTIYLLKKWTKEGRVVIHWLLIAPAAAALTFQSPHALRAQNMVVPLVIISAIGLIEILRYLSDKSTFMRSVCYLLFSIIFLWNFVFYIHQYYVHMAKNLPYSSQYGVAELVDYIKSEAPKDKEIVISDRYDQPYVLFLFYLKYPPAKFQENHTLTEKDNYGFSTVRKFDRFRFINLEWEKDKLIYQGAFIAGPSDQIPQETNIIKKVYGSNGFEYFNVVAN